MTEHQKLINKAKKIASMMQSPYENEVIVAASLLQKLLDEHNMNLQELGLKNLNNDDLNRTAKDVTKTGNNVSEVNNDEIVEIIYKHSYCVMDEWIKDMIVKIARAYGVRTCVISDYVRLVGYPSDVEIVKLMLVNLRKFIETGISKRGYTDKNTITSYAFGLIDRIIQTIRSTPTDTAFAKSLKLADYMCKHYGIRVESTYSDPPAKWACRAYQTGLSDGDNYKRVA